MFIAFIFGINDIYLLKFFIVFIVLNVFINNTAVFNYEPIRILYVQILYVVYIHTILCIKKV